MANKRPKPQGDMFTATMPLFIMGIGWAKFVYSVARRKNVNVTLCCFLALIPIVGAITTIWAVSNTDRAILERLAALEERVGVDSIEDR